MRKTLLQILVVLTTLSLILTACAAPDNKMWAGQIVRDIDTTGTQYKVVYVNEGSTTESQRVDLYSQGGSWNAVKVAFGKSGNQLSETLQIQGPRTFENYSLMTAEEQDENVLNITKSKFQLSRWVNTQGQNFQTSKNEITFTWPGLVQDPMRYQSTYKVPISELGEPDFVNAQNYYDVIYSDTILGNTWAPYSAVITNSMISRTLGANWAQTNMQFDAAMQMSHDTLQNLKSHSWKGLDPQFGDLKLVLYNKNNALELIGFENPFYGTAYDETGKAYNYRIVPLYQLLDQNLYFGWAKQNTRGNNTALRSLLWQVQTGSDPNIESSWSTVAGMHYLKGRFQANALYFFKVYKPGEDFRQVVDAVQAEMDSDIPENIRKVMDQQFEKGGDTERLIMNWVASRKPFNMSELVQKYGLSAAAVVRYQDISDSIWVLEPCGEDCSRWVNHVTTPRKQLVWNIAVAENGVEDINDMFALTGEGFAKAFDIGYVQPGAGDGTSFVFGILRSYLREKQDTAGYPEAVRLDQRAPVTPEGIDAAIHNLFGSFVP